jgi:biopolymer transport protein ExbB
MIALLALQPTDAFQTMVTFFTKGGLFMWPLLLASIVTVATIILSALTLREKKVLPLVIESEIERLVPGGSAERLLRIVTDDQSSLARVVRVALHHLRWPRAENIESVQTRARRELVRLERGLIVLEVVTGIAPLIGLIGTVSGLVHVFSGLGLSTGASDTKAVALGISEALNCTIFGLSIAVPALISFSYFSKKVEVMSVEIESLVSDLIAKCYYGRINREEMPATRSSAPMRPAIPPAAPVA